MASEYNRDIKTRRQLLCFISKKTLFFDCDTEVNGDLTPMFDCQNGGWWPTIHIDAALSRKMDFPGVIIDWA